MLQKSCTYPLPRARPLHLSGLTPAHFLSNATKSKQKRLAPAWALRCATGPLPPASLKRTTARNRSSSGSVSGGYASGRLIDASSRPGRLMGHTIKIKSQADQEQIKSRASGQRARARARARAGYDVPISQNSAKNLFLPGAWTRGVDAGNKNGQPWGRPFLVTLKP